jgi:hypothetical protein
LLRNHDQMENYDRLPESEVRKTTWVPR